jgi:uncharacterized RmlC-like cupin family protein
MNGLSWSIRIASITDDVSRQPVYVTKAEVATESTPQQILRKVQGAVRLECGAGGLMIMQAEPGDHLLIPKYEVHRESNPTDEEQVLTVVRVGSGPVVVNVDPPPE